MNFTLYKKIMSNPEYGDLELVGELLSECRKYQNSFIQEHAEYLRVHLDLFKKYKRQAEKDREWDRVSSEFYDLRQIIDGLLASRKELEEQGTEGSIDQ